MRRAGVKQTTEKKGLPPLRSRPSLAGSSPAILLTFYLLIALAPLALAHMQDLPRRSFSDELSSALAMVGFAMLLMEFALSGRFRSISGSTGIDLTMRFHQLIARSLTAFIVIHPFLYVTPLKHSLPWDSTGQLTLGLSPTSTLIGFVGWLLLVLLVVTAICRDQLPYRYETWRLSHGLGAALIAILGSYHTIDAGRYSGHAYLTVFWLGLLGLALSTLLYVYIITPLLQLRHPYRVVSVKEVARKTWELNIEPKSGMTIEFAAGQFVWLTLDRSPFAVTEHPFSISSCPANRPIIGFTIKEVGDFTNKIGSIPLGARAYIDGPHGNLTLAGRSGTGIAFIAGGVGLAPIMSILRQLSVEKDERPLKLIYGNRLVEQIMYQDELDEMKDILDIEIHHTLSEPPAGWVDGVGQLDEAVLRRYLEFEGHARWLYVVCGPAPMIDGVESNLEALGVPLGQIVSEKFSYD